MEGAFEENVTARGSKSEKECLTIAQEHYKALANNINSNTSAAASNSVLGTIWVSFVCVWCVLYSLLFVELS